MKYFISYETSSCTGNAVIDWEVPICSYDDIRNIEIYIQRENSLDSRVLLTNWKHMEMPE